MKRHPTLAWLVFPASLLWAGDGQPADRAVSITAPEPIKICTDYDCDLIQQVRLEREQWHSIWRLFRNNPDPASEREAIRRAIAELETLTGRETGTWADRAGNSGDPADPGQLDCVAESLNSTTYLRLLSDNGLLRWHEVEERRSRNPWLFDYHWTAVIRDRVSRQSFAVDSWFLANGKPPAVQPIEDWQAGNPPEPNRSHATE